MMAFAANSFRSRCVSLVCLLAIVLFALPCAAPAQPTQPHTLQPNTMQMHCDACYPATAAVTLPCCVIHSQPAQASLPSDYAIALELEPVRSLLHEQLSATPVLAPTILRTAPPPLLQTNLRI